MAMMEADSDWNDFNVPDDQLSHPLRPKLTLKGTLSEDSEIHFPDDDLDEPTRSPPSASSSLTPILSNLPVSTIPIPSSSSSSSSMSTSNLSSSAAPPSSSSSSSSSKPKASSMKFISYADFLNAQQSSNPLPKASTSSNSSNSSNSSSSSSSSPKSTTTSSPKSTTSSYSLERTKSLSREGKQTSPTTPQKEREDFEEGLEIPLGQKNILVGGQKRQISQASFSNDWSGYQASPAKPSSQKGTPSHLSITTNARIDTDFESYDDMFIPENPREKLQSKTEDDTSELVIPDESYLDPLRLPAKRARLSSILASSSRSFSGTLPRSRPLSHHGAISRNSFFPSQLEKMKLDSAEFLHENDLEIPVKLGTIQKVQSDGTELDLIDQPLSRDRSRGKRDYARFSQSSSSSSSAPKPINELRATISPQDSVLGKKTVVSTEMYGDGSELDLLGDLPIPAPRDHPVDVQAGVAKPTRKMILIKNLNKKKKINVIGNMTYNPDLQRWDGNWEVLKSFENPSSARPALITQLGNKIPQVVGGMRFDREKAKWLGNEEEADVFSGIDNLDEATDIKKMFEVTDEFRFSVFEAAKRHNQFLSHWMKDGAHLVDDDDQEHLFLIRGIAKHR